MRIASLRIGGNDETFFKGEGVYPGDPSPGYIDVFKAKHSFAPVPEDYPEKVADAKKTCTPSADDSDVKMSAEAFKGLLKFSENTQAQAVELARLVTQNAMNAREPGGHHRSPGPMGPFHGMPTGPRGGYKGYRGKNKLLSGKSIFQYTQNNALTMKYPIGRMGGPAPRIQYQPNGLPVPLGKGKPRYRGKKPTRGKFRGKIRFLIAIICIYLLVFPSIAIAGANRYPPKTDRDIQMTDTTASSSQDPVEQQAPEDQYEESWEDTYEAPDPTKFGMDA
ncbi:hypothetical protein NLI96_g10957 [Meripilus lineatus]|uniref:Uncharacterized protein n=1 Tax=Meripilus lineatus TaxID=2056292 RepID=A0AAD5UXL2_9APHY|nr:hypothetical protein NLI96_g10957 [Physisporinus lineatus]